jgi:hypothetical protein
VVNCCGRLRKGEPYLTLVPFSWFMRKSLCGALLHYAGLQTEIILPDFNHIIPFSVKATRRKYRAIQKEGNTFACL